MKTRDEELAELQARLGYRFRDPELLERALTHRSWVEEQSPGGNAPGHQSQQRLEFLGDALLGYVVARWVYEQLPTADEGELTRRRIEFTQGGWLAAKGASLGLRAFVHAGRGEAANPANGKLDEDTAEALLGAILLDSDRDDTHGGTPSAEAVRVVRSWLPAELPPPGPTDSIIVFGEWFQDNFERSPETPSYVLMGSTWSSARAFEGVEYEGAGATKQAADRALYSAILEAHPEISEAMAAKALKRTRRKK